MDGQPVVLVPQPSGPDAGSDFISDQLSLSQAYFRALRIANGDSTRTISELAKMRPDLTLKQVAKVLSEAKLCPDVKDGSDWREFVRSKKQLTTELPKFLISGLIPEKALTFLVAPSYNCKTWFALACGKAISTGKPVWGFNGPREAVSVLYHVPEMHEALVRQYMEKLEIEDSEMFLVRTMEQEVWPLDHARMIESSKRRAVFLDTTGYFNPADEESSYKQSLDFARLVYHLLNAGCRGLVGLYHPPKYSSSETVWTLENSILGSAGYGGILRSCLRMRNLNPDTNESNPHVYVEGLKNPSLKPFQLEGIPLRMKVPPGESPTLQTIVGSKTKRGAPSKLNEPTLNKLTELLKEGLSDREIGGHLGVDHKTVAKWKRIIEGCKPAGE